MRKLEEGFLKNSFSKNVKRSKQITHKSHKLEFLMISTIISHLVYLLPLLQYELHIITLEYFGIQMSVKKEWIVFETCHIGIIPRTQPITTPSPFVSTKQKFTPPPPTRITTYNSPTVYTKPNTLDEEWSKQHPPPVY